MYLFDPSLTPALSTNAQPLSGAKLYVYLEGTVTPTPSYTDETGGTEHTHPVVANSAGRFPPVYIDETIPVRIKVTNAAGSDTLYDAPYIAPQVPSGLEDTLEDLADDIDAVAALFDIGLFSDFAGTPPTIPSLVNRVQTSGWGSQGFGKAWYDYDSSLDSADVTANPDTMFEAADGRIFKLDIHQFLRWEMFGGKADGAFAAATGTDNLDAAYAVAYYLNFKPYPIPFTDNIPFAHEVHMGHGFYYFSDSYEPRSIVRIIGTYNGTVSNGATGGTVWVHPADTTAFITSTERTLGDTGAFDYNNTSSGTLIQGIYFRSLGGTNVAKHGVHLRGQTVMRDCGFDNIPGNAVHINATVGSGGATEGNANTSRLENIYVHDCGRDGLHIEGNDSNAITIINFSTSVCGGCGIYDASGLGNNYFGLHIAGYGFGGVFHLGSNYILISQNAALGQSTTPGTNAAVWFPTGTAGAASSNFPQWSGATVYYHKLPIGAWGTSNRSVFMGIYVEGGLPCHIEAPAMAIGGQCSFTSKSNHQNIYGAFEGIHNSRGFGGAINYATGTTGYTNNGAQVRAAVGTPNIDTGDVLGINIWEHYRASDAASGHYSWVGKDTVYKYLNQKAIFMATGPNTLEAAGRSAITPYYFKLPGVILADATGSNGRIMGYAASIPTTGFGVIAKGEIHWSNASNAAGKAGWYCTTAGTAGSTATIKPFAAIDA